MNIWHKLSHLFGLNSSYSDLYVRDGWMCSARRCATCNQTSDELKLIEASLIDAFCQVAGKAVRK